jgi:hypothetical protein
VVSEMCAPTVDSAARALLRTLYNFVFAWLGEADPRDHPENGDLPILDVDGIPELIVGRRLWSA